MELAVGGREASRISALPCGAARRRLEKRRDPQVAQAIDHQLRLMPAAPAKGGRTLPLVPHACAQVCGPCMSWRGLILKIDGGLVRRRRFLQCPIPPLRYAMDKVQWTRYAAVECGIICEINVDSTIVRKKHGEISVDLAILPNCPHLDIAICLEVLRFANVVSGRKLFDARIVALEIDPVQLSDGQSLSPRVSIDESSGSDIAIVVGGHPPSPEVAKRYGAWLRRIARLGAMLGGIDWGVVILAEAGLLDGCRVAVHWEVEARLREHSRGLTITEDLYAIDRNRITCAGRCAVIEMMLHLVRHFHGSEIATATAQDLVYCTPRPADTRQRPTNGVSPGSLDRRLARCLSAIEAEPETAFSLEDLARMAKLSPRYLQKMSKNALGVTITEHAAQFRLSKARDLVLHTEMPMMAIASATGFGSASVFARAFRKRYGRSARSYRSRYRQSFARPFAPESSS